MLNDKDKEYLKQNVEKKIDNLDKKLDSKKSSATNPQKAKSLNELYKDKKEDKDKLLETLQEREKKGENTLAQKIEMLNLTIKKSLPEEFKDGVKAMTTTMKQGGSQALKGVDSIISKIASVNPMLAMLYSGGKDISKAAWNITAGTAKMGFGLAKGIGQGTAGILKSAFNLFNRRKKQEEETDDKLGKVEDVLPKSSKEESGNEEDYELSTAKKIDEIHKAVVVDLKKNNELQQSEEKKRHSVLSKGLAGLGKTMKGISEVAEFMMAKQKLIIGGVMLGALGILALVGWFKNGGFKNMMDDMGKKILGGLASEGGQDARKKADAYVQGELGKIKEDAKEYTKNKEALNIQSSFDISKNAGITNDMNQTQKGDAYYDYIKKQGTKSGIANTLANHMASGKMSSKYSEVGVTQQTELKFPFKTRVVGVDETNDKQHVGFEIYRVVGHQKEVWLYFTNAVKNSVKKNTWYEANTVVALLTPESRVWGDIDAFYGLDNGQTAEEALYAERAPEIAKQANKIMDDAYHTAGLDSVNREADRRLGVFKEYKTDNLKDKPFEPPKQEDTTQTPKPQKPDVPAEDTSGSGTVSTQDATGTAPTPKQVPKGNMNNGNKTDQKVESQKQEIKKTEEQERQQKAQVQQPQKQQQGTQTIALQNNSSGEGIQPAEVTDITQSNAMLND